MDFLVSKESGPQWDLAWHVSGPAAADSLGLGGPHRVSGTWPVGAKDDGSLDRSGLWPVKLATLDTLRPEAKQLPSLRSSVLSNSSLRL